ncbi:MAG TPA: LPXTG cell wall anchor domain-containing protein, partial [Polyangium sp.]|nr:LPXTG cell wall anchor domain-containing protein [Polyangium sp.]
EGETNQQTKVAKDFAFAPRGGVQIASFVRHDVPEIHLQGAPTTLARVAHPGVLPESDGAKKPDPAATPATSASSTAPTTAPAPATSSGCGACAIGGEDTTNVLGGFSGLALGIASFLRRKKRRNG